MKLGTRFFVSHALIAVVSMATCLSILFGAAHWVFKAETHHRQFTQLEAFASAAEEARLQREDIGLLNFMSDQLKDPTVAAVVYQNVKKNRLLVVPGNRRRDSALKLDTKGGNPPSDTLEDGTVVDFARKALGEPGNITGVLQIAYSRKMSDELRSIRMKTWLWPALAAGLVTLLLSALVSYFLSRQLVVPIKRIASGTKEVREGKLNALVDIDRDDELGTLARDFNAMTQQLSELDRLKRDFVAGVTHDLGTPLLAIRSSINLLQSGELGKLNPEQTNLVLAVANSSASLTGFIESLLTTANIESGKVKPYTEESDAVEEINNVLTLYADQAREKGLQLVWEVNPGSLIFFTDRVQFRQMITNLVSNAIKYTDAGTVSVSADISTGRMVIKVKDTGIGIEKAYHDLIFDRFYRVKENPNTNHRKGAGLGLAITRGLARSLGGDVSVANHPEGGSVFTLDIPLQPDIKADIKNMEKA